MWLFVIYNKDIYTCLNISSLMASQSTLCLHTRQDAVAKEPGKKLHYHKKCVKLATKLAIN